MQTRTVTVPKISCGHCTATIERELGELDGVTLVQGDPGSKQVKIEWSLPATWGEIRDVLSDIGYPAVGEDAG